MCLSQVGRSITLSVSQRLPQLSVTTFTASLCGSCSLSDHKKLTTQVGFLYWYPHEQLFNHERRASVSCPSRAFSRVRPLRLYFGSFLSANLLQSPLRPFYVLYVSLCKTQLLKSDIQDAMRFSLSTELDFGVNLILIPKLIQYHILYNFIRN